MGKIKLNENELSHLVHQILEQKNKHVTCERCDWDWDITADDEDPYLCHMCGHRNDSKTKKRLKEQDVNEPNQFVEINLQDLINQRNQNTPTGPIKILFDKLYNKELVTKSLDLEVYYSFMNFSQGPKLNSFSNLKYDPSQKYISGSVSITKVLYKGQDVTELVKIITNDGSLTKKMVKESAYDVFRSFVKNLGLEVGQIKVMLF